jgi:hypothetical protein
VIVILFIVGGAKSMSDMKTHWRVVTKRFGLKSAVVALVVASLVAHASPASAQQTTKAKHPVRTRITWTLVGAAVGAGLGFALGFRAYEDAAFSERKITEATMMGAVIGGAAGFGIGWARSRPPKTASLWKGSSTPAPTAEAERFSKGLQVSDFPAFESTIELPRPPSGARQACEKR